MPDAPLKIARGLTLYGKLMDEGVIDRGVFLDQLNVNVGTYRHWMRKLAGGDGEQSGLRFFDSSDGKVRFGAGAGVVLGVSLGTTSLRAGLFDANGDMYHQYQGRAKLNQLDLPPNKLLDRIRTAARRVLEPALKDERLLVNGKLRFRGVAVAWPAPINRDKRSVGHALSSRGWSRGASLTEQVARHLGLENEFSHAVNDAWAAAIAAAFDRTRERRHIEIEQPELTLVLRLAGGIGAATIVVEPSEGSREDKQGGVSGFAKSILLGGRDAHAGELGHVPVCSSAIAERNKSRPAGLGALKPHRCSCTPRGEEVPGHLEAYVSREALAQRIAPNDDEEQVIQRVLSDPHNRVHRRALEDIGVLTADCLLGAKSLLNPARITLTGSLVNSVVRDALDARLYDENSVVSHPKVDALDGEDNEFIRARGAALAVLRRQIYRRLETLVGGREKVIPVQLRTDCMDIDRIPWA